MSGSAVPRQRGCCRHKRPKDWQIRHFDSGYTLGGKHANAHGRPIFSCTLVGAKSTGKHHACNRGRVVASCRCTPGALSVTLDIAPAKVSADVRWRLF